MRDDTQTPPARRMSASPLWMRLLLVGSLAANLLIVGVVAGAVVNRPPPRDRTPGGSDPAAAFYLGALPEAQRREVVRKMWREMRDENGGREALKAEVEQTLALLREDTLDAEALHAAVRRQRSVMESRRELGDRLFIDYLEQMEPDARRAYADRLEERLNRRWRR